MNILSLTKSGYIQIFQQPLQTSAKLTFGNGLLIDLDTKEKISQFSGFIAKGEAGKLQIGKFVVHVDFDFDTEENFWEVILTHKNYSLHFKVEELLTQISPAHVAEFLRIRKEVAGEWR